MIGEKTGEGHPKVDYLSVERKSFGGGFADYLPDRLKPTKRFGIYFGLIFLGVVLFSLIQFPFDSLMTGNINIVIGVGYPLHFLEFGLKEPSKSPLLIRGLVLDMLLYLAAAYVLDVGTGSILGAFSGSEENPLGKPKVFESGKR